MGYNSIPVAQNIMPVTYIFRSCRVIASVTSSTHEIKSKTVIFMEKEKIYLQLNQFTKPVCI
jgi:hypothetical protein